VRIWTKKESLKFAKAISRVTILMPDCEEKRKADTLALDLNTDWKAATGKTGYLSRAAAVILSLNEWAINHGVK